MKWLRSRERAVADSVDGFVAIGHFEPADVFIAGYPKSGNSWMQLLVSAIVYGLDPLTTPDTLIQELVPDVHYKKLYKRFLPSMVFKTHQRPCPEYRRVINIVRDGRDVLCSYRHFGEALGLPFDMNAAIDGEGVAPFGRWEEHVAAWNRNPYDADKIVVRYEDLLDDCVNQLARMADFLGVPRTVRELERIAVAARFEAMQRREVVMGWDNKAWPRDKAFLRQGKKNAFTRELTPAQLRRFESRAGRCLQAFGYGFSQTHMKAA